MPEFPPGEPSPTIPSQSTGEPGSLPVSVLLASMVVTPEFRDAILTIPINQPNLDLARAINEAAKLAPGNSEQLQQLKFTPEELQTIQKAISFSQQSIQLPDGSPLTQDPMLTFAQELAQDQLNWLKRT